MIGKLATLAAALLISVSPSMAAERLVRLSVPDMFCASCPYIVQAAAGAVEGVISVDADANRREATVLFEDSATTVEAVRGALLNAGYASAVIDAGS